MYLQIWFRCVIDALDRVCLRWCDVVVVENFDSWQNFCARSTTSPNCLRHMYRVIMKIISRLYLNIPQCPDLRELSLRLQMIDGRL